MSASNIITIIDKYNSGTISEQEKTMLYQWLQDVSAEEFHLVLNQCENLPAGLREIATMPLSFADDLERRIDAIEKEESSYRTPVIHPFRWQRIAAAASIIILLGFGGYQLLRFKGDHDANTVVAKVVNDFPAGRDGAILTLSNGTHIVLDTLHAGSLASDGQAAITKELNGQLSYHLQNGPAAIGYNTLTTPKGKKTSVVLPDGTTVWLNAASSLSYPTRFTGKERLVKVSGEAYFEVARNTRQPFVVQQSGSDYRIEVLGTHFNVNLYEDENTRKTTLLEGSVRVASDTKDYLILKPGEQAVASQGVKGITLATHVNTDEVVAWKNGNFMFDRADIRSVMRQISRWYDVEVEYKGNIARHFGGTISRNVPLSKVFEMLEMTGAVKFTIHDRKIEVTP